MGRTNKLYYLEHEFMRDMFYYGGRDALKKLSDWHYYRRIVRELNRREPDEPITLKEEDFTVTEGRLKGNNALVLKVDMPEALEAPLCRTIYMVCSEDMQEKLFATVELYENGTYGLCAWLAPGWHVGFETDFNFSHWGERERIREIFEGLPEMKRKLSEIINRYEEQRNAVSG